MKKSSILCLVVSVLLTTSCNKEEFSNATGGVYTLTGTVEENTPITRAGFDLNQNGSFFWNNGDAIAVGSASLAKYTTTCEDKSKSATFTSNSPASGYAVYPWEGAQSMNEHSLSYKFKSEYTYETVDTDFFSGMSVDIPMWAKVEGNTLSFKHLGGVFAFKFSNLKAGQDQTFTMTADAKISGTFTADLSTDEPKIETSTTEVADADKKVTINFSLANDADAVFYVPVPVGTYGIKVEVKNGDKTLSQEYKGVKVDRRDIRYTTLNPNSLQGSEAKVVETASEVTGAMEENTNVVLTGITSESTNGSVSIELPKKSANSDVAHSLSIGSIDANTETIEIKESKTDSEGNSIEKLVISVPTTEDAKKLVIDMPNTTVSILVNGLTQLTLEEVTATTAESTLIVSNNVTIQTLKVNKGNVRVQGSVTTISRGDSNSDEVTYVIKEDGAEIPETLGDGFRVVSAAEWDLMQVFNAGGTQTISLTKDVELTRPLTLNDANANITINLGTYSLTNNTAYDYDNCGETECYVFEVQNGTLNINGSTGSVNAVGGSDYDMAVYANTDGKVNINGGKFTNKGKVDDGSDLIYASGNAVITISGGEFEAGNKSKDVGEQYVALNLKDGSNASITVSGGTFHKFNPAYNVSENPKKNFAANNTMVAVSGTEGNEIYEVIDLSNGYTMTSDIEIATPITINTTETINFNLGTYNLTNNTAYDYDGYDDTECYVFEVQNGTLEISGTGSVNAVGGSNYDMAVYANTNGKVNISGGKFTNKGIENDGSDLIYASGSAEITISGGEFEAGNKSKDVGDGTIYVALNLKGGSNASITVSGGTFHKFNPAAPGTETADWNNTHSNGFVSEGYTSAASDNGETYVVTKSASDE